MKLILSITLSFLFFTAHAQTDQTLDWFTYFGGSESENYQHITELPSGGFITAGEAESEGMAFGGAHQNAQNGEQDVWITKWGSDGSPIWSTYYGGESYDFVLDLTTDHNDNIIIVGYTHSEDYIAYGNAHQEEATAYTNAYIAKFDSDGQVIWATYLTGTVGEVAEDVVIDEDNNIYVTGVSNSPDMSDINDYSGGGDAFISKFSPEGNLEWYLYRGGDLDDRGRSIALYENEIYHLYGTEQQEGLATDGAEQEAGMGEKSLILEKLDIDGNQLWARYISGNGDEFVGHIAVNQYGIFVALNTDSSEGLGTEGAFAETKLMPDSWHSYAMCKFSFNGNKEWGTFFGEWSLHTGLQSSFSMNISEQFIFFSTNIGSTTIGYIFGDNPFQPNNNSSGGQPWQGKDVLVMKWDLDGFPVFGTLFGGNFGEGFNNVIPIMDGEKIVIVGSTDSEDFYQSSSSFQEELAGESDAFIAVLSDETLSTTNFLHPDEIKVFPNPNANQSLLHIELDYDISEITLVDLQGKEIARWSKLGLNPTIELKGIPSGMYVLKIYSKGKFGMKRLVIE